MTYQVIVRPEAAREIQEAFDWYEERSEGLGLEFLRTADVCLSSVRRNRKRIQSSTGKSVAHSSEDSHTRCFNLSETTR